MIHAQEVLGPLTININSAEIFEDSMDAFRGLADPYLELLIDGELVHTTEYIKNSHDPEWGESFTYNVLVEDLAKVVSYKVWDDDTMNAELVGEGTSLVSELIGDLDGDGVDVTKDLYDSAGAATGKVHFTTSFTNEKAIRDAEEAKQAEEARVL